MNKPSQWLFEAPFVRAASPKATQSQARNNSTSFKKHPRGGYARYGGSRVDQILKQLRDQRMLSITDAEIDTLQRIANVETGGLVQAINSYDSAFMSMGFMQLTIKYNDRYNPNGKLQRLIQRAPDAFRKYGIELATTRYKIYAGKNKETGKPDYYVPLAVQGAPKPDDLRSLEWAERFYAAGLDPAVIIAQAKLALEILKEDKQRIVKTVGGGFLPFYDRSPVLRALIHETFNNRPVYLYRALKQAITKATQQGQISPEQFLNLLHTEIRAIYQQREKDTGLKKANNLINKTAKL
jgi:hypothetical protein